MGLVGVGVASFALYPSIPWLGVAEARHWPKVRPPDDISEGIDDLTAFAQVLPPSISEP